MFVCLFVCLTTRISQKLRTWPLTLWPQKTNEFPGLVVEHLCVKFSDPCCIGFWDIVRKKTDTQTNSGKNRTPPLPVGVGRYVRRMWFSLDSYCRTQTHIELTDCITRPLKLSAKSHSKPVPLMWPHIKSFCIDRRMESIECLNAGDEASCRSTAGRRYNRATNSVWWGFSAPTARFVTRKEVKAMYWW